MQMGELKIVAGSVYNEELLPLMDEEMLTCGQVKEMYKESMCCGNPSHIFSGSRRLTATRRMAASVDSDGSTVEFLSSVRSKLTKAKQESREEVKHLVKT